MTNKPKKIGTGFETAVCRYLRERLQDDRIERRALHGSKDCGDIYGLYAHGFDGIAECKAHKSWNQPARLAEWREQTLAERANSGAGFAVLVVKVPQRGVAESVAHVTLRDLARVALPMMVNDGFMGEADGSWVSMTLSELCALIDWR